MSTSIDLATQGHNTIKLHGFVVSAPSSRDRSVYRPRPHMTRDEWRRDGETFNGLRARIDLFLGDWYNAGRDMFGDDFADQVAAEIGVAEKSLIVASWVARCFSNPQHRRPELKNGNSFRFHMMTAKLAKTSQAEAARLMDQAEENGWSSRQVGQLAKIRLEQLRRGQAASPPPDLTALEGEYRETTGSLDEVANTTALATVEPVVTNGVTEYHDEPLDIPKIDNTPGLHLRCCTTCTCPGWMRDDPRCPCQAMEFSRDNVDWSDTDKLFSVYLEQLLDLAKRETDPVALLRAAFLSGWLARERAIS